MDNRVAKSPHPQYHLSSDFTEPEPSPPATTEMDALVPFHMVVGFVLVGLGAQAWLNHRRSPRLTRGTPPPVSTPGISVLIPARNEAARIEPCVRAWMHQAYPNYEVVIYDDDSTDETAARVRAVVVGNRHTRLVVGGRVPEGWRGKPYACHRLRARARGEILVFADADVMPSPSTLSSVAAAFSTFPVDAVSAVPRHVSRSRAVLALVALQNWAALTFLPSWCSVARARPLFAAMNGQFMAIRTPVYDAVEGFAAVRGALAEDVALGRRLAERGYRIGLLDGASLLTCTPYSTLRDVWRATLRNLPPVFFRSAPLVVATAVALTTLYLGPIAILLCGLAGGHGGAPLWSWIPLGEIALGMLGRLIVDRRVGYPSWLVLTHPVAVAALVVMMVAAATHYQRRRPVDWRGRRYTLTDRAA